MITSKATVKNKQGIHVRPSGVIIGEISSIDSSIKLRAKGMELPLLSIMDLLALGLQHEEEVEILIEGGNEEESMGKVVELFEREYDFPPSN